jgi:Primase C terminal 2 (PriCT-2)
MGGYKFIESCLRYLVDNVFSGMADKQCVDANRFFYGATGKTAFILDNSKTLPNNFFDLVKENEERVALIIAEQKAERKLRAEKFKADNPNIKPEDYVNLIRDALIYLEPRVEGSGNYSICLAVLMGLHHAATETEIITEDDAFELIDEWSPENSGENWYPETKWNGFSGNHENPTTIASIFWYASQFGWEHPHKKNANKKSVPENAQETIERINEIVVSNDDSDARVYETIVTDEDFGNFIDELFATDKVDDELITKLLKFKIGDELQARNLFEEAAKKGYLHLHKITLEVLLNGDKESSDITIDCYRLFSGKFSASYGESSK